MVTGEMTTELLGHRIVRSDDRVIVGILALVPIPAAATVSPTHARFSFSAPWIVVAEIDGAAATPLSANA